MQDITINIIQSDLVWENSSKNLKSFDHKISQISNTPDLVVLPEMFNTGFTMNVESCAEAVDGPAVEWMKNKAVERNCVVCGSVLIRENKKYYNRFFWVSPLGNVEFYNKRHLFRMAQEHLTMTQGMEKKIVELNGWKINLQVCFDLRFPVWSKNNFNNEKHDYDVLIYVANWPEVRSHAYKSLLLARALENQAYVVWVNRVGVDGNDVKFSGDSMVIDPYGKVVGQIPPNKQGILSTTLSSELLNHFREKFNVGQDWDRFQILD